MRTTLLSISIALLFIAQASSWTFRNHKRLPADEQRVMVDDASASSHQLPATIPGGSPFSFCEQSRPADLYNISMIHFNPQPLYFEHGFGVTVYGTYQQDIGSNATYDVTGDCGSHCKAYGHNHTVGTTERWPFCMVHNDTEQLDKIGGCPPVEVSR